MVEAAIACYFYNKQARAYDPLMDIFRTAPTAKRLRGTLRPDVNGNGRSPDRRA